MRAQRAFDFTSCDTGPLAYRLDDNGRSVEFTVPDNGDYVNALIEASRPAHLEAFSNLHWHGKSIEERAWGGKVLAWIEEILNRYCTEEWLEREMERQAVSRESARSAA